MITELTITPEYGDSLTLSVPGPSDGYLVKEIEGLDPVPVGMVTETLPTREGGVYQSSRLDLRNIVLKIKLDTNYAARSISSRKQDLYALSLGKQELTLSFVSSVFGSVSIKGRVEDFDSPEFTNDPLVTISIQCFDPDFVNDSEQTQTGLINEVPQTLEYQGSVPAGLIINLGPVPSRPVGLDLVFTHNQTTRIIGRWSTSQGFTPDGRTWSICSIPGQKFATRSSTGESMLEIVDFTTLIWPLLIRGDITYSFTTGEPFTPAWEYELIWFERYGAI